LVPYPLSFLYSFDRRRYVNYYFIAVKHRDTLYKIIVILDTFLRGVMVDIKEFEKIMQENATALAKIIIQDQPPENNLLPVAARENKVLLELSEHSRKMRQKIEDGIQLCITSLDSCEKLPMSKESVLEELATCFETIDTPDKTAEAGQAMLSDVSWKNFLHISNNCMECLFQGAKAIFEKKAYDNAEKAFFVLCALDPTIFSYWAGFGHASFQQGNYQQAIDGYSMAAALHPQNMWPHVWAANAFEKQGDHDHAKMALEEALALVKTQATPDVQMIQRLEHRLRTLQ